MTNVKYLADAKACSDEIIRQVGPNIRVAAPLAAGKPNHLLNALYQKVKASPELNLIIFTALTLEKPKGFKDLERRFFGPFSERVFGNYPDLDYELDRVSGKTPSNIQIIEFYFPAGKYLSNPSAQTNYISSNYTHVARDLLSRDVNVVVQQVAKRNFSDGVRYSLSCNADVTLDIIRQFQKIQDGQKKLVAVQVNDELPFMYGDAVMRPSDFDLIVDEPKEYYKVFGPPKMAVGDAEYMIGLYDSVLVRDGGELQIGIGTLGDSLTAMLLLRQNDNEKYRAVLERFRIMEKFGPTIKKVGAADRFEEGLFGSTEMVVDGFYHLLKEGVLKRKVYDNLPLQRLLNEKKISEKVSAKTVDELLRVGAIRSPLNRQDFDYLKHWGVFREDLQFESGEILLIDGRRVVANLEQTETRSEIFRHCLGEQLKHGAVIHGGFFLGPQSYYKALKSMSEEERQLINMRSVSKINQLYGHEELDRLQRKSARFINTCLMMTVLGGAVSDGLEDGRVVSGIGGQYNFVSMAHALPDGRSILNLRSTRKTSAGEISSMVWNYGHISIPRHLRDIVVTEYGIADLRGKTDAEVIAALLNITDSRFQNELLVRAKKHSKIPQSYQIPDLFTRNTPDSYVQVIAEYRRQGLFERFPFGTDFTEDEIQIGAALRRLKLKTSNKMGLIKLIVQSYFNRRSSADYHQLLKRMNLHNPRTIEERLYARLLINELK